MVHLFEARIHFSAFKKYLFVFGCCGSALQHGLSLVCCEQGLLCVWSGLLTVGASLAAEHRL